MFIRRSPTRNKATGESYFTYRLVRSERLDGKVRQLTLLNLGRHFPLAQDQWPTLCARVEQLIGGQAVLLPVDLPEHVERMAQRYAGHLVVRADTVPAATPDSSDVAAAAPTPPPAPVAVDIDSLELLRPRSVGVEHVGLWAIERLRLEARLAELGFNGIARAAVIGSIIGRLAAPGSERATWDWLCHTSALGELLDVDFEGLSAMRLYRASDALIGHRDALEAQLFAHVCDLFGLEQTITLFDLTNTSFEGDAAAQPKATRGRSKEKRSDCPLMTLGLVLDGSGFVRRSRMFEGNAVEARTLQGMLAGLGAVAGAMVILDAGIATQANLDWLVAQNYRYLVVRRGADRQVDFDAAVTLTTANGAPLRLQKVLRDDGRTMDLYCHSPGRELKEAAMNARLVQRFDAGLQKLADGLKKPRGQKRLDRLQERIGRLKERSRGIGQHYQITLEPDASGQKALSLTWKQDPVAGSRLTDPGIYCLTTNETNWDEATLWRTYILLTDLEAVFRSLKSDLGLRPIFHTTEGRTEGHLFITVLAYQCVHLIRSELQKHGIHDSWATLRRILSVQRRVTATFRQPDGHTLNVRKSTLAEPDLRNLYQALGLNSNPGGTRKLIT